MSEAQSSGAGATWRAAIIGCGRMAHGHAQAYVADPRVELVACADISPEAASGFAATFGIPARYESYVEMLERERPDIVSITTHHHLHAPMTIETARVARPRAILCEKPIALDLQSADEMIAACNEAGTRLLVGHQRRYDRQTTAARQALHDGRIGEVVSIEAFGHPRSSLLVDSTHTVDLVRYLLGDPRGTWVIGQMDAREHREAWGQQIEDCAMALIGFDSGHRLLLGAGSIAGDTPEQRIQIAAPPVTGPHYHRLIFHGTTGLLQLNGDRPVDGQPLVEVFKSDQVDVVFSAEDFESDPGYSSVKAEVSAMIDCLEQPGLPHLLEAQSARDTLEILIAIYESSRRRQAVRLPLDTKDNPLLSMLAEGVV